MNYPYERLSDLAFDVIHTLVAARQWHPTIAASPTIKKLLDRCDVVLSEESNEQEI